MENEKIILLDSSDGQGLPGQSESSKRWKKLTHEYRYASGINVYSTEDGEIDMLIDHISYQDFIKKLNDQEVMEGAYVELASEYAHKRYPSAVSGDDIVY